MAKDKANVAEHAPETSAANVASGTDQSAPVAPNFPPSDAAASVGETPVETAAPQDSKDIVERQKVSQDALARQLDNKPARPKRRFHILAKIDGEQRSMDVEAADDNEAWAMFCDSQKLKEAQRPRRFARPSIRELD